MNACTPTKCCLFFNHDPVTPPQVSAAWILNIDGVYIGDRTSKDGVTFYPDHNNTRRLPFAHEMSAEQRARGGEFEWALFPGSWGGFYLSSSSWAFTCLTKQLTQEVGGG